MPKPTHRSVTGTTVYRMAVVFLLCLIALASIGPQQFGLALVVLVLTVAGLIGAYRSYDAATGPSGDTDA